MFSRLSDYLYTKAKGSYILISFSALVLIMGITLPLLDAIYPAGHELISLDDPVIYTSDEVLSIVENWGKSGRTYQLWFHLTWDVIVPVLNFLFLGLLFSWLLQRSFSGGSPWRMLNLVALVTVFDLLENASLISITAAYPSQSTALAGLKTFFTVCKFSSAVPLVMTAVAGLILSVKNKFRVQEGHLSPWAHPSGERSSTTILEGS